MCGVAGFTLLVPRTPLAGIWSMKPGEYRQLMDFAPVAGTGFFALSALMAASSIGCFHRKRWGWLLAVLLFAANAMGDAARAISGDLAAGLVGVFVAGAVLVLLFLPAVRRSFPARR